MNVTLVLFDIDGTLLDAHGAGRQSFINALDAVFGWKDSIEYISFQGSTDLDVLRQIASRRGVSLSAADVLRFFKQLPVELERTTSNARLTLHPGVKDLLAALDRYPQIMAGLVTGNVEECAQIKLRKFDLHGHFLLGAFGHEHADRGQIAGLALERARRKLQPGQEIAGIFLIGDTPSDISAAKAIGARSIAVATGQHDRAALEAAGADHVLENLADVGAVLRILQVSNA